MLWKGGEMKCSLDELKFIIQTLNRIEPHADVEFHGNAWRDGDVDYKSLDSIAFVFAKEKNEKTKLIIKIS